MICIFIAASAHSQETPDSLDIFNTLEEVEITGSRLKPLSKGNSMQLSQERILQGARVFGEADAIRYIGTQPGVTTVSDYGSGIMIDGSDVSHVLYRIEKVPVFFPFRFGGIFSTFNAGHFSKVDFERGFHNASMPSRLGAKFDFYTLGSSPEQATGSVSVGILSSSISIIAPIKKFTISASARVSYIDQIYGSLLQTDDFNTKYNFQDFNLSAKYNIDYDNSLLLNLFGSNDNLKYDDGDYAMDTHLRWNNALASVSWSHFGNLHMSHRLFYSGFFSSLKFLMPQFAITSPSGLQSFGAAGDFEHIYLHSAVTLNAGYELNSYLNRLQEIEVTGFQNSGPRTYERLKPVEARLYADSEFKLPRGMILKVGLSASYYRNSDRFCNFTADPRLTFSLPLHPGTLSFHFGKYTQYLHQLGFSQIGLASDFWISSKKGIPEQTALSFELDYSGFLPAPGLYFSANLYWRRILHQPEYRGELLSIIDSGYDVNDYISVENGFNTGGNVSVRKNMGPVTGGVGVGYGIARRRLKNYEGYIRARSEPGFSINLEAAWHINAKWDLNGNFKLNSGRPYTPILAAYLVAGNLISEYGEPNSALLPAWHRLDLSATLKLRSGSGKTHLTHLINFGIINVYGHRNIEFMTYKINIEKGEFHLKQVASLYRFLPTLSYTLRF